MPRSRRGQVRRRRLSALLVACTVAALAVVAVVLSGRSTPVAGTASPTAFRTRIVTAAQGQLGYRTDPSNSYCNKFSAYWGTGTSCGHGLRSEEWCADFAAWVWKQAGARFVYSFATGDIDSGAGSFYTWAVAHGTWHPAGHGYVARPGDVAVYGLDPTTGVASHVAVVVSDAPGQRGPDVVNGDGDHTGFSVVEAGRDQARADAPGIAAPLAGYASPIPPATAAGPAA